MKKPVKISVLFLTTLIMISCSNNKLSYENPDAKILFLHHSTGQNVWKGKLSGLAGISQRLGVSLVPKYLKEYNRSNNKKLDISETWYPGNEYGFNNNPFDYYNLWVAHAGNSQYMGQSTLEILTATYNVIIFKHCFPSANILEDDQIADINSEKKTLANYKLQYNALKTKLREFKETKFIIWTLAASVEKATTPEEAGRAREFVKWVKEEWDQPDDNIFVFDFNQVETVGSLYLKPEFATSETDSHPNEILSKKAARLLTDMIIEVIENNR
jgi:hypothetical protein